MTDMLISNMAEWPAPNTVFAVSSVDIAAEPAPHPFHLAEEKAAADNWEREVSANPALFNGRMVLQRDIEIRDGAVRSRAHVVPFSTFLLWRKERPDGAFHLYGLPVIVSGDGAIIAIRMAAHTANPGMVYCAAGSLDDTDVSDGRCDLDANMAREVREETGLDLSLATSVSGFFGVHTGRVVAMFRLYHFTETADELCSRIHAHMLVDPHPEIEDAVIIRNADLSLNNYTVIMRSVTTWFFNSSD